MKKYVAKVGTPDALKQLDSDSDRETLIEATDVYHAHKLALNKCNGVEEVLSIVHNNKKVYDIVTGFASEA